MSHRTGLVLTLAAAAAFCAPWRTANAQRLAPGPQVLTFFSDVDDSEQPYGLYLPKNYDEKKKYPLVIMLHGAQSNHRLSLKRVFGFSNQQGENDLEATRYFQQWADVDYIVASPLARGTMGYKGIPEKDVWDVVADVKRRFHIDEDRTYLTGLSMGGGGTLWIGLTRPDVWAAIAPVCPAPPFGTVERAPNALNFPVHFFQGGADPVVNPEGTRQWRKRLEDLGTKVEYVEYPGVRHNSWEKAYADEAIFKWFGQFKRNKFPDRVRFVTDAYQYGGAYWIKFDKLTPGTFAKIDAQFKAPNRIEIATSDLDAFTVNLAGHPKYAKGRQVEITIDGASLKATGDSIGLVKENGSLENRQIRAPAGGQACRTGRPYGFRHRPAARLRLRHGRQSCARRSAGAARNGESGGRLGKYQRRQRTPASGHARRPGYAGSSERPSEFRPVSVRDEGNEHSDCEVRGAVAPASRPKGRGLRAGLRLSRKRTLLPGRFGHSVVSAYGPGAADPRGTRSGSGRRRTRWRGSGRRRIRPSGYFARNRLFRPGATLVNQVGRLHFVQGHTHQHPGSGPV